MTAGEDHEPNPPKWPSSVKVFYPNMKAEEIMESVAETQDPVVTENNITSHTSANHYISRRWALLFAPGEYRNVDIEIGYYVQLLGLGQKASDVKFLDCEMGPHVPSLNRHSVNVPWGIGLDTFWRCAENFYSEASGGLNWVVSQAAPLRRVHVATDLNLCYGGAYVSGGVLANAQVDRSTNFGGQQQWLSRNVDFLKTPTGGAWSTVFVGCRGSPESDSGSTDRPSVSLDPLPRIRVEKPYITITANGTYQLRVPPPTFGEKAVGTDLNGNEDNVRDFDRVKVARDDHDNSATLQQALDAGKDLVLSPGTYALTTSLKVRFANQVILGIGLATLVAPKDGSPCIRVLPDLTGVRVAGIMLQASKQELQTNWLDTRDCPDDVASLLEWGYPNRTDDKGQAANPGVLTDVFARVGGPDLDRTVSTDAMIRIHSGNVVGDNLWLWRADHVKLAHGEEANYPNISTHYFQTMKDQCKCANGLIVNGDHVTIHGLAVEHTEEHQVIWKGDHGQVSFYQSELPYDVDHFSFGAKAYAGYLIDDSVGHHDGLGWGIYSNFRDFRVRVKSAIQHPRKAGIRLAHLFTVRLDNYGLIESVVNGQGTEAENQGMPYRVDETPTPWDPFIMMMLTVLVLLCAVGIGISRRCYTLAKTKAYYNRMSSPSQSGSKGADELELVPGTTPPTGAKNK